MKLLEVGKIYYSHYRFLVVVTRIEDATQGKEWLSTISEETAKLRAGKWGTKGLYIKPKVIWMVIEASNAHNLVGDFLSYRVLIGERVGWISINTKKMRIKEVRNKKNG